VSVVKTSSADVVAAIFLTLGAPGDFIVSGTMK
jgi:hypothetical protein